MNIKICGMKYPDNILDIVQLKPDFLGFIFYPKSKRYILDNEDIINKYETFDEYKFHLETTILDINPQIQKVGVFVNAEIKDVIKNMTTFNLHYVQLHGDESPEYCEQLKMLDFKIIKAFGVDNDFDFQLLNDYQEVCDYFLFDTKTSEYGGSGQKFDWNILENYKNTKPIFLSGGLDTNDFEMIKALSSKINIFALDFNSKLETKPGFKVVEKCKYLLNLNSNFYIK